MRLICSFIIALALTSLVRAQDTTESPAASAEQNPAASMQAPSSLRAAPSATPEAQPSASASAAAELPKSQASPAASPARAKKTSTATAEDEETSSSSRSDSAANSGPDKGRPESAVKRLENEWETAVMKHDASFIEARVGKDFLGVSSRGKRLNKSALIKEFKSDTDTYSSAKNGSMSVHAFDKNVVIASGTAKEVGKTKDGTAFARSYLFTDTWVLRGERWECVASQVMLASGK